jgi:hypothetical protein
VVSGGIQEALAGVAEEIGLRPADLLLLTRLFVFVEGPHDEAVLGGMFGEELERAGIRLIPIFGTDNAQAIVDSTVIHQLDIPLAIFADNLRLSRLHADSPITREEIAIAKLLVECRERGIALEPMGHSKHDILEFIDDSVFAGHASASFPGWNEAARIWRTEGRSTELDIKSWMSRMYGLKLDRYSVRQMARECAELNLRPHSLSQRVKQMVVVADRSVSDPPMPEDSELRPPS